MTDQTEVVNPTLLTEERRQEFEDRGFLVIRDALTASRIESLLEAHDRVYAEERAAGRLGPGGSMHLFAFVLRDDRFLELLDMPTTFPLVWGILGWNIYMYHCHLDVHPRVRAEPTPKWSWHQDGGRQNLEIETAPTRPRLSVKLAYFLTDASEPGRGNFMVVPGSHRKNSLTRPAHEELGFDLPVGAMPILAEPGTAVLFDRRLWHSRSENSSSLTRKAVFLGYTYRWIRPRDDYPVRSEWFARLSPIRRQLLGGGLDAMSYWGLGEDQAPLHAWLAERGLLDHFSAPHR